MYSLKVWYTVDINGSPLGMFSYDGKVGSCFSNSELKNSELYEELSRYFWECSCAIWFLWNDTMLVQLGIFIWQYEMDLFRHIRFAWCVSGLTIYYLMAVPLFSEKFLVQVQHLAFFSFIGQSLHRCISIFLKC